MSCAQAPSAAGSERSASRAAAGGAGDLLARPRRLRVRVLDPPVAGDLRVRRHAEARRARSSSTAGSGSSRRCPRRRSRGSGRRSRSARPSPAARRARPPRGSARPASTRRPAWRPRPAGCAGAPPAFAPSTFISRAALPPPCGAPTLGIFGTRAASTPGAGIGATVLRDRPALARPRRRAARACPGSSPSAGGRRRARRARRPARARAPRSARRAPAACSAARPRRAATRSAGARWRRRAARSRRAAARRLDRDPRHCGSGGSTAGASSVGASAARAASSWRSRSRRCSAASSSASRVSAAASARRSAAIPAARARWRARGRAGALGGRALEVHALDGGRARGSGVGDAGGDGAPLRRLSHHCSRVADKLGHVP